MDDDGVDVSSVQLSDDGSMAMFIRGSGTNRVGWVANPSHDPNGGERAVWAARTDGSGAWRLAVLTGHRSCRRLRRPRRRARSSRPTASYVVFVKDGQIFRARTARGATAAIDTGGVPFIKEWGRQSNPQWSPDGSKLAFVSTRDNHAFIGVYDMKTRKVDFMAPSVDFDGSPTWSPDGKRIAFMRRPGTPFGQQTQQGDGRHRWTRAGRRAARSRRRAAVAATAAAAAAVAVAADAAARPTIRRPARIDGLYRAAFPGGYTMSFMVADVATGKAHEFWHQPAERSRRSARSTPSRGPATTSCSPRTVPNDEWDRFYSVSIDEPAGGRRRCSRPTDGLINDSVADRTFVTTALSRDGKTFYYCTNAKDIEKRHIWAVPTSGGTPRQISTDDGVEVSPTPLRRARTSRCCTSTRSSRRRSASCRRLAAQTKVVFPTLPQGFPAGRARDAGDRHHARRRRSGDSQSALPAEGHQAGREAAGDRVRARRAVAPDAAGVSLHAVLPLGVRVQPVAAVAGLHRAVDQLPERHRLRPRRSSARRTRKAAATPSIRMSSPARSICSRRADVDPARVGIWGLSYGGLLTARGARAQLRHLRGRRRPRRRASLRQLARLDESRVSSRPRPRTSTRGSRRCSSSRATTTATSTSRRWSASSICCAHTTCTSSSPSFPDDVHESLMHSRWIDIFSRSSDFLHRFVWEKQTPPVMTQQWRTGR